MAEFPKTENEIVSLAYAINSGYVRHPDDFPHRSPGVIFHCKYFEGKKAAQQNALAKVEIATKRAGAALDELVKVMRNCLKQAQADTKDIPEKLYLIGWAPNSRPGSVELPACPVNLAAEVDTYKDVHLRWCKPDQSCVRNYIIEARAEGGQWRIFDISYKPQLSFSCSRTESHAEFRVRAVNTAGKGLPSNTVSV